MTLRPGARRATINDVARAAGVSRQTVSNVVNRPDRVAPATRARVQAEIERLAYRPSSAAKSLREQRAGAIGHELSLRAGPGSAEIAFPFLTRLAVAARQHRCHVVTFGQDGGGDGLDGYESMVNAHLVDAFVLSDTRHRDPRPSWLTERGIPFATFGRVWDDPGFTVWADVDGGAGTRAAVRHLVDAGYDRIGFLGWHAGSEIGDDRRRGWRDAADEVGRLDEDLAVSTPQDLMAARDAARDLLRRLRPGDAVVCVSDVVALGARAALCEAGLRPGRDIGLVGFDGSASARMYDITSVEQPIDEIVEHLLDGLDSLLAGQPQPETGALLVPTLRPAASSRRT